MKTILPTLLICAGLTGPAFAAEPTSEVDLFELGVVSDVLKDIANPNDADGGVCEFKDLGDGHCTLTCGNAVADCKSSGYSSSCKISSPNAPDSRLDLDGRVCPSAAPHDTTLPICTGQRCSAEADDGRCAVDAVARALICGDDIKLPLPDDGTELCIGEICASCYAYDLDGETTARCEISVGNSGCNIECGAWGCESACSAG